MKDLIIEDFPMSEIEFEKRFNTEQACMDYLAKMKWPEGFCCQRCGHQEYWISAKRLYICIRCESGYSLTAGTVMHRTKKPLAYWFNRRTSRNIGKKFMRIVQQASSSTKTTYRQIVGGTSSFCLLAN